MPAQPKPSQRAAFEAAMQPPKVEKKPAKKRKAKRR